MANEKAKEYDPNAEYVCVRGTISIRAPKTNLPRLITPDSIDAKKNKVRFKMPHRTPGEIAYLVNGTRNIQLATEYDKAQTQGGKS